MASTDILESPESPDAIRDSPESPDQCNDDELLFFEDRRPGNVSPSRSSVKCKPAPVIEDFIRLSSEEGEVKERIDESGANETKKLVDSDDKSMNDLEFIEDRNPVLSGQETNSPRYSINDNFMKLQNPKAANKKSRILNTCWNCGDTSHALRDCTEPRDHVHIAKCRREFQESKANMPVFKRYHKEESQTFRHLVPGELSEDLRHALGLDSRQLPAHIYMMRRLGYPPGWLQEALISHSGIAMFDGLGKEVLAPGVEGGEIVSDGMLDKYDARKIVQYPGFNVPPPPETYDDSQYWNCPPMSKFQSLEVMLQKLEGRIIGGYKRRKLSPNATMSSEMEDTLQSTESQDMDYEEVGEVKELPVDSCSFVPPLPEVEQPPPPPSELPPDACQSSPVSNVEEASLVDLEEQKKELLAQLNDVSPLCSTPQSKVGKIRSVDLGTPILKSVSPFSKIPTAEKFSVNICDVINFENLPDSTGKYDQMSGIIQKVRSRLSKLNSDA